MVLIAGEMLNCRYLIKGIRVMTAHVEIYTTVRCPYCTMAKQFLDSKNIKYQEINIDNDAKKRERMIAVTGQRAVPQIIINNEVIGGYTDLLAINKSSRLNNLLTNLD